VGSVVSSIYGSVSVKAIDAEVNDWNTGVRLPPPPPEAYFVFAHLDVVIYPTSECASDGGDLVSTLIANGC
jgi:hypothetical protein